MFLSTGYTRCAGQKVLNKEWQHNSVRSRLEMPAVNAVYGNATEALHSSSFKHGSHHTPM
eukprot:4594587-Amphidinium_carterae.1